MFCGVMAPGHRIQATVSVWVTGDTRGHLAPCQHCPDTTGLGGIARRATMVSDFRSEGQTLLLDVGDFLYGGETAKTRGLVMVEAYNEIGYDAVNVSFRDFRQGLEITRDVLEQAEFPLISANIREKEGELLFPPYVLKEFSGKTYAIVGISERPAGMDRLPHLRRQMEGLDVDEPLVAWQRVCEELEGKADTIILLFHGSAGRAIAMIEEFSSERLGLLVVSGEVSESSLISNTAIVGTHRHGTMFTQVELGGEESGLSASRWVEIQGTIDADEAVQQIVASHQEQVREQEQQYLAAATPVESQVPQESQKPEATVPTMESPETTDTPEPEVVQPEIAQQPEPPQADPPSAAEPEVVWPEFRPHEHAVRVQANEEGKLIAPVEWDIQKPLLLEFTHQQLSAGTLLIHLKIPENLQDKVWDLSVQTDQQAFKGRAFDLDIIESGVPSYHYRVAIVGEKKIPDLQRRSDWNLRLLIPRALEENSLKISLAALNFREAQPDQVTRPSTNKNVPWNAEGMGSVQGYLDKRETQYIRFVFDEEKENPWRLRVTSPEKALEDLYLYEESGRLITSIRQSRAGEPVLEITDFYPYKGTYVVGVRGTDQEYRLEWLDDRKLIEAEGVAIPEGVWEREPNNEVSWAQPLHWETFYIGRLRTSQDSDYYRLYNPGRHSERVEFTIIPATDMALEVRMAGQIWRGDIGETFKEVRDFLPGDHVFHLRSQSESKGFYQVRIERVGSGKWDLLTEPPLQEVSAKAHLEHPQVAAYWPHHQRVLGVWEVTSRADQPRKARVELVSSHANVHPLWREEQTSLIEVEIPAGGSLSLPIELLVEPDLRDDYPVFVDVRFTVEGEGSLFDSFELHAHVNQPAIHSHNRLLLPESMAGGIDVAAEALGAEPLGETARPGREVEILQGLVRPGGNFMTVLDKPFTIKLAGGQPHPLVGFAIHPMIRLSQGRDRWLREFRIETSEDGENWKLAVEGELSAWAGEQYFPLEREVSAAYIRFTGLSQHVVAREYGLGSFKAIARPGYFPESIKRLDLASAQYGGHQVVSSPRHAAAYLTGKHSSSTGFISVARSYWGKPVEWIIGFHHNRVASIEGVTLTYMDKEVQSDHPATIEIEVAQDSPLGPWRQVGVWDFPETLAEPWEIRFDEPVHGRFVRFIQPLKWEEDPGKASVQRLLLPRTLSLWESREEKSPRSILGEWGHYSRKGPFEWRELADVGTHGLEEVNPGGTSADTAVPVKMEDWSQGYVSTGEREAHYVIDVLEGQNHLKLDLLGVPDIAWHYELVDHEGNPVRAWLEQAEDHAGRVLQAQVDPGRYRLRIWEPIRNIAIAWDNSGSMGPYLNPLYASIRTFLTQVDPAREKVQLLAFSRYPYFILNEWTGNRSLLLQALLNYHRKDDSSDSEPNLLFISQSMEKMEGTKAILLLTDAESGGAASTEEMWKSFEKTRPRIFTLETSSGGSTHTQDLMQDWADANHGIYDYMRNAGEVEIAFARATAHLRRPKYYQVKGGGVYVKPPEPGILQTEAEIPPAGSYYFIFDASGSMMAPIGDQRKFDVARDAVSNVIGQLPDHAQVALRIYGHTRRATEEGADQDTALEVKMGALNEAQRALLLTKLERLRPRGRTPLTLSLAQAIRDIGRQEVTIVLLTDGGEDTVPRQDPVAEATKLGAMENAHLVVVGFDIQREDWSRQLNAIAEAAGAEYLPAPQAADLEPMLRAASGFKPSEFQVLDDQGTVVGEGLFGDQITLPPGRYEVKSGENARTIQIHSEAVSRVPPF